MKAQVTALLSVALAAAALVTAQAESKGKQVIDKAIAALGGERFLHMQNRVARGRVYSFFRDQLSGLDVATIYTEYVTPPPAKGIALREREVLGKKHDYSYLFLPDQGWDVTYRGARPVPDETWERYFRATENDALYILKVRHDEPGLIFDYVGSDVYLSLHVEIVDITDAQSRTVRVYFDHNTMLPAHATFTWMDPVTKEHNDEGMDYDKYRDIGEGVMWPYSIERQRNGYKTYEIFATTIEVNQPIPAKTFDLPPGVKVLKKVD
jgi:hypothetical protein